MIVWVLYCVLAVASTAASSRRVPPLQCERITVHMCSDISYNYTRMPNFLNHSSQAEANMEIHQFFPLVRAKCSPDLQAFLCSVYVPKCVQGVTTPPSRTLCESSRRGCESLMNNFGFVWPDALDCSNFPLVEVNDVTSSIQCEPITVPMCLDIGYNYTRMPNFLNHSSQAEANMEIHQFFPLVQAKCSPDFQAFLCSVYVPKCVQGVTTPLFRTLCESSRLGCEPLMNRFGFVWPDALDCSKFSILEVNDVTSSVECEPITVPFCLDIGYKYTRMPNMLNHSSEAEANMEIHQFHPLVQAKCSPDLQAFLCSVYVPKCVQGVTTPLSRTLCESSRRGCESLMNNFGFVWPDELDCSNFPLVEGNYVTSSVQCEPITVPMCSNFGYNYTRMPNFLNHSSQEDAGFEIHQFFPLVQVKCSPDFQAFLCSVYVPNCEQSVTTPLSRTLCESSRRGCEPLMNRFGLVWPDTLDCSNFPLVEGNDVISSEQCEPITVPMCLDIGYNYTRMPNFFNHSIQEDAGLEIHQFFPLVKIKCSLDFQAFLCSVYVPKCVQGVTTPPSRTLCESSRRGCEPLMKRFSFDWPDALDCSKFSILEGNDVTRILVTSSTTTEPLP